MTPCLMRCAAALAEIGIVADYVDTSGLIVRPWLDDRLVALLPRAWPMGKRQSIPFGSVLERPLVGLSADNGLSRFLAAQASRSGRVPRHRVRLSGFDAVAQLVATGCGSSGHAGECSIAISRRVARVATVRCLGA